MLLLVLGGCTLRYLSAGMAKVVREQRAILYVEAENIRRHGQHQAVSCGSKAQQSESAVGRV